MSEQLIGNSDMFLDKIPSTDGHRERLRQRFLQGGIEGFYEHEALELALFYTIDRVDTKDYAKFLIYEFGSIEKVFTANYDRLLMVLNRIPQKNGHPTQREREKTAFLIKYVGSLVGLVWRRIGTMKGRKIRNVIEDGEALISYLESTMKDLNEEVFRVVFLNNANRIIKDEILSAGTEDQTAVYPKKIMRRALEVNATGIILVHNHPAGRLQPSNADLNITTSISKAAELLGIRLLDHLIIGDPMDPENIDSKRYYSFRENGLI